MKCIDCGGRAQKRSDNGRFRKRCAKCRSRKYKKDHPFAYFFNVHRNNARSRNIKWDLTLEEFREIWEDSGKWEAKLRGENWEMDRKNVNKGYEKGNIKIIEKWLNVYLWYERDRYMIDFRWRERWSEMHNKPIEEAPF